MCVVFFFFFFCAFDFSSLKNGGGEKEGSLSE